MRRKSDDWTPFSTLQGFVRLTLLVDWDPIGILGYSGAMDEYDSYAAEVSQLLRDGASIETLATHLDRIETQQIGVRGNRMAQAEVAEKLVRLYHTVLEDEKRSPGKRFRG